MNKAQRDLLAKSLADVAKGVFVGALLASGTGKLPLHFVLLGVAFACVFHIAAHVLIGGNHHE